RWSMWPVHQAIKKKFVEITNAERFINNHQMSNQKNWKKHLQVWVECHIKDGMKMTMFIDDGLLARVMEAAGTNSKTKAVDLALREMDRRARLAKLAAAGLGMEADELKEAVDPAYSLQKMRQSEMPVNYGRKSRPR